MDESATTGAEFRSWPRGISAIAFFVEDLDVMKQFYGRIFGLPLLFEDNDAAMFKIGTTHIKLLKTMAAEELYKPATVASREPGSRFVLTLPVDDVDAMCTELAARGVELLNGPVDRPWGVRTASFSDPAGNIWEIAKVIEL
jgi:catechol 2,3-dioxygenase-like lactoylglutathione lyase family enzyme